MKSFIPSIVVLVLIAASVAICVVSGERLPYTEEQRLDEYVKRGYQFPFSRYVPDTEGWKRLMDQRFAQVQALEDNQMKWDGWIQTITSAVMVPNFTEYGWGLTQGPASLTADIRQAILEGLPNARPEGEVDVIEGPLETLFIDRPDLTQRVCATATKSSSASKVCIERMNRFETD
jgi:hypothetical protein